MKKQQSGFTLIELIIVIIVLGILAVVAAPKLLNFADDAKISVLQGAKGAMLSSINMVHAKAVLESKEKSATSTVEGITLAYGYPEANATGIQAAIELDGYDTHTFVDTDTADVFVVLGKGFSYTATAADACQLLYKESTGVGVKPVITEQFDGCKP